MGPGTATLPHVIDEQNWRIAKEAEKAEKAREELHKRFVAQLEEEGSSYNYFLEKARQSLGYVSGLNDDEKVILYAYTYELFHPMNRGLRQQKLEDIDALVQVLNNALAKFDDYKGLVKRGVNLPPEVLAEHEVGAVVTYAGFTSTSVSKGFAGKHQFVIKSKHGKLIDKFSSAPTEEEVLFKSGTKFKILDRKEKQDGSVDFVMEEVE